MWLKWAGSIIKPNVQPTRVARIELRDTWDRTRQCSQEADRLATRFGWRTPESHWLNHYNVELTRCFVVTQSVNPVARILELDDLYDAVEGTSLAERSVSTSGAVCSARSKPWSGRLEPMDCTKYDQLISDRMEK